MVWLTVGAVVLVATSRALMPGPFEEHPSVENPLGIAGTRPVFELVVGVGALIFLICLFAGVVSVLMRFSRSRGDERQQLKWFVYASALIPVSLVANSLFPDLAWSIGVHGRRSCRSPSV